MEHAREEGAPEFEAAAVSEQQSKTLTGWAVGVVCLGVVTFAGWSVSEIRSNASEAMKKAVSLESDIRDMKTENKYRDERFERMERKLDLLLQDRGIRVP